MVGRESAQGIGRHGLIDSCEHACYNIPRVDTERLILLELGRQVHTEDPQKQDRPGEKPGSLKRYKLGGSYDLLKPSLSTPMSRNEAFLDEDGADLKASPLPPTPIPG